MGGPYGAINEDEEAQRSCCEFRCGLLHKISRFPKVYIAAIAAFFSIVNLGLVTSYTAPAGVSMMESKRISVTADEISWIASMASLGAMVGGPLSGILSQRLGRKAVLMYTSMPYVTGWLLIGYATSVSWIYAGRIVTGVCIGLVSVTVPTYIVEISTPDIRGLLGTWFNVAFASGVLLDMGLGALMPWSWLAISGAVLAVTGMSLLFFMPESPYWLISKGYDVQAAKAIEFLRGDPCIAVVQHRLISKEIENERKIVICLKDVFKTRVLYKPITLCVFLMFFQQFSGINALMSYTVEIFQNADISWNPSLASIVICAIQVLSTMVCSLLMDKVGRRPLFVISGTFLCVGLGVLGLFSYLTTHGIISSYEYGWMPVVGFVIYLVAFSLGFGPVPWVMSPEMVPTQARSYVVAVAAVCTNFFLFVVVKTYDTLRETLDDYGVYFFYAGFCFLGCIFCLVFVPETKGKALNEIQKVFNAKPTATEKQKLLDPAHVKIIKTDSDAMIVDDHQ